MKKSTVKALAALAAQCTPARTKEGKTRYHIEQVDKNTVKCFEVNGLAVNHLNRLKREFERGGMAAANAYVEKHRNWPRLDEPALLRGYDPDIEPPQNESK